MYTMVLGAIGQENCLVHVGMIARLHGCTQCNTHTAMRPSDNFCKSWKTDLHVCGFICTLVRRAAERLYTQLETKTWTERRKHWSRNYPRFAG